MKRHFQSIKAARIAATHRAREFHRDAAILRCDDSAPGPFCVVPADYARDSEYTERAIVEIATAA